MATITARKRKNGSTAHLAQIVLKSKGKIIYRENQTFDRKGAAYAWAEGREQELKAPGGLDKARNGAVTFGTVVDKYIATSKHIGRNKMQVLLAVRQLPISDVPCSELRSSHIIELANQYGKTAKPQTVLNYLSNMSVLFSIARPAWGYPLGKQTMQDAIAVLYRLGSVRNSEERDRRPTLDELDKLMAYFADSELRTANAIPMTKLILFAIFSARRRDEICRIRWDDLEPGRVIVRDMKHPGKKQGNDIRCDLPDPCGALVASMPRVDEPDIPV